jgi:NAD(P)-dependent dehydrogenase (short-subunit alcohol dehydrogenase family)
MADSTKDSIVRQIPLGRTGSPQDIADCVIFLARDATYSSGHIMAIDGGRSVGW